MIAVLGGLADVERDLIRTRIAEDPQPRAEARAAYGPASETGRRAEGGSTVHGGDVRRARPLPNSPAATT